MISDFIRNDKRAVLLGVGCALWFIVDAYCFLGIFAFCGGSALFFSYLSLGQRGGLISSVSAAVCTAPLLSFEGAAHLLLEVVIPTTVLGYLMMRNIQKDGRIWWYPESFLLRDCVVIFYIVWIIMAYTLQTEANTFRIYENVIKAVFPQYSDFFIKGEGAARMKSIFMYYGGILTFLSMFEVVFNLEMACAWGRKLSTKVDNIDLIRGSFDFLNLRIPNWLAVFPLVTLLLAKLFPSFSYVLNGLTVGGMFAPAACGFSLIYWIVEKNGRRKWANAVVLLTLIFPIHVIGLIALVGAVDSFLSLRKLFRF